jgi:hypothetical protein
MRVCGFLLAILVSTFVTPAHPQTSLNGRLCIVPVADSATEAGHSIVSHALMLPGVSRPILYPAGGRAGLWTIDEARRLVRMPGPALPEGEPSRFAQDPKTGRIVAMGTTGGLFALSPQGPAFEPLWPADKRPLSRPHEIRYSARLDGFVVFDINGVFRLTRDDKVVPLPVPAVSRTDDGYDLPAFDGKLTLAGRDVVMRYDDGERVELIRLPTGETMRDVEIGRGGTSVIVRTETFAHTVTLPEHRTWRSRYGLGHVEGEELVRVPRKDLGDNVLRVDAPSIGKALLFSAGGLYALGPDGRTTTPVLLPFDPKQTPIRSVGELPASRVALIFTTQHVYAMDQDGIVTIVPGGDQVGPGHHHNKGIIPGRNEMLVAGTRGLYLVVNRTRSGAAACATSN